MTKSYQTPVQFSSVKRRHVEVDFSGGDISSNAGVQLLAQVDKRLGLCRRIKLMMSSACAHQQLFRTVAHRLNSP